MSILSRVRAGLAAFRTSPEDPRTNLANPDAWLYDAWGGTVSNSGVRVTEKSALAYSAAFACINVLAKDVAQMPLPVYERNGEDREIARAHPVYKLLHDRPNPMMTPFTFKQTLTAHLVAWGNAYAEIETTGGGVPIALWPLLPDRTSPVIRDGQKFIKTSLPDGREVLLPASRVLHVPGLGFDGVKGYSVIQMAKQAIGAGMAAETFGSGFFKRGALPAAVLHHPKALSPDARKNIRDSWQALYGGLENTHRTAILEEGMTLEKLGMSQTDAQFIDTSKFSIEQVARFFDIPLMRLHSTTAITSWGTGLEQWLRGYLVHTLGPWLTLWEESLNWALINENERETFYVEFMREKLLEGDTAAKSAFFKDMVSIGVMSPNQVARKLNLPGSGPDGDTRFVPLNWVPIALAINPPEPEPPAIAPAPTRALLPSEEEREAERNEQRAGRQRQAARMKYRIQQAQLAPMKRAAERYVRRETQALRAAIKQSARSVADFQATMEKFYRELPEFIKREMSPVLRGYFDLLLGALEDEVGVFTDEQRQQLERGLREFETDLAAKHIRISTEGLRKKIADSAGDDVWASLDAYVSEWDETRAGKIADWSSVAFAGTMSASAYALVGIVRMLNMKMTGQACPVCDPLNGRVAHGTPPNHGGCSCVLVAG